MTTCINGIEVGFHFHLFKRAPDPPPTTTTTQNTKTTAPYLHSFPRSTQSIQPSCHLLFCLLRLPFRRSGVFFLLFPVTPFHISLLGSLPSVGYVVGVDRDIIGRFQVRSYAMQAPERKSIFLMASFSLSPLWALGKDKRLT